METFSQEVHYRADYVSNVKLNRQLGSLATFPFVSPWRQNVDAAALMACLGAG